MGDIDNKKMLEEIRRIAKQGSPFAETGEEVPAAPAPVAPAPVAPVPERAGKDEVVIPKDDFEVLVSMAKKEHEREQHQIQVEPQQNINIPSMDFGGLVSRPTVLYFDTDRTCQLVQPKVKDDGSVVINERTFDFTKGQPSIMNLGKWGRKQSHPFYIIKYDNMTPLDITKYESTNPTPEQASRLVELGTLQILSKIPGGRVKKWVLILIMIVSVLIGAVSVWMLNLFGVI